MLTQILQNNNQTTTIGKTVSEIQKKIPQYQSKELKDTRYQFILYKLKILFIEIGIAHRREIQKTLNTRIKKKQTLHRKFFRINNLLVEESLEQYAEQKKTTVYSTCMVHQQLEEQQHPCFPHYSVCQTLTLVVVVENSVWEALSQKEQNRTTSCEITSKVKVPHLQQD